jgi:Transposase DDE domain group 1
VIAKVEWHPGELVPRVGFIVTNMSRRAERVVAFYNKRGACEQWIKEGKGALKWTRLSRRTFAANAAPETVGTSRWSCGRAGKAQIFASGWEPYGGIPVKWICVSTTFRIILTRRAGSGISSRVGRISPFKQLRNRLALSKGWQS